jgi:hypothetical protein
VRDMKYSLLLFIIALISVQILPAAEDAAEYTQRYAIFIDGALSGHENVKEKLNDAGQMVSTSDHDLKVIDGLAFKHMAFTTRMVFAKNSLDPVSYSYQYTEGDTGDSYDVIIEDSKIKRRLRKGGRTSEATAPFTPETIILDYNVYHHFDYLIRKYNKKKGGRQTFSDFIPIIGLDIPVYVTFMEDSSLKFDNKNIEAKGYRVELAGIETLTLFTDKEGRLIQLQMPSQKIEVLREDLAPK